MKDIPEKEESLLTEEVSADFSDIDIQESGPANPAGSAGDPAAGDFFDSEDDLDDFDSGNELDDFDAGDDLEDFDSGNGLDDFEPEGPEVYESGLSEEAADGLPEEELPGSVREEEEPYLREEDSESDLITEEQGISEVSFDEPFEEKKEKKAASAGLFGRLREMAPVKRAAIMAAAGAVCVLIVFGIVAAVLNSGKSKPAQPEAEEEAEQIVLVEQQVSDVRFLSFGPLSVKDEEGYISVKDFSHILDKLYADGYVLIDLYSLGQPDESGKMVLNKTIDVPEGKEPLVILQRDVSYPISRQTDHFAKRLVVDSEGFIRTEYTDEDNESYMGDYDLIPMLETFIREHPDFSYNGARGIIGLTGYNGILGYRTSAYLGSEEDNPYGTFDTQNQVQAMQTVLEALQSSGWRFASNGFGHRISYGSEYPLVENDAKDWEDQVEGLIGGTDILMFPRKTDIGSWAPYDEGNTKYTLMRGLGFRYYLLGEDETPGFMLARNEYLRIAVTEINTNSEFEAAFPETTEEEPAA